jgi:PAS domain S-box-containing protein
MRDENGRPIRWVGIDWDVTEQKLAEIELHEHRERLEELVAARTAALQESEDRLSKIMLAVNDGTWDWDLVTNGVNFDPRYYEMAGYAVNEFPHRLEEFQKRVHTDDIGEVMKRVIAHINGQIPRFQAEFRFKQKDGDWLWVLGRGVIVEWNDEGAPARFMGTHTDISDRKRAEEALKDSEERFRHLVEMSPDGIVLHRDEKLIYANNVAAQLLRAESPEVLLGRSINSFVHPDHWSETRERGDQLIAGEKVLYPAEDVYMRLDGTAMPVEISAATLTYHGITAVQVIFRDISERKANEAAARQRVSQLAILNDIGSRITAVLDLNSVLERAANLLQKEFGYDHVALFLIDREQNEIILRTRAGVFDQLVLNEHRLKMGEGLIGWVATHKQTLLVNDINAEPRYVNFYPDEISAQSELTVPIQIGEEVIGILDIQS